MLKEQKHYNFLKYKIFKPGGRAMVVFYLFLNENILRQFPRFWYTTYYIYMYEQQRLRLACTSAQNGQSRFCSFVVLLTMDT